MRYVPFPVFRYLVPVLALGAGIVAFLPGSETPVGSNGEAVASSDAGARMQPSYLAASPELIAELDAALSAQPPIEDLAAREALLPDPTTMTQVAAVSSPAETPAAEPANAVRVGGTAVNLRAGPSKTTAKLATLQPGQALTVGEVNNGWTYVTTPTGESGWVYSSYLNGGTSGRDDPAAQTAQTVAVRDVEEPEERREDGQYARLQGDTVLRAGPSRSARRLFVLPAGERVAIAEIDGRWARVVLKSGASGWLPIR
jgi:uncharacterized protein YgiM (DUF1202 family)